MGTAHEIPGNRYTYEAAADLSTKMFRGVKHVAGGDLRVNVVSATGGQGIGVLQNKPSVVGEACTVMVDGVTKAIAGGTIVAGDEVTIDSNAAFVGVLTGNTKAQTLTRTSTGGTITVSVDGETTVTIPASAAGFTAAALQAALRGLSNVGTEVSVSGSDGGPLIILGEIPDVTVDNTSATGGTITTAVTTPDTVPDQGARVWGVARSSAAAGETFALLLYPGHPAKP